MQRCSRKASPDNSRQNAGNRDRSITIRDKRAFGDKLVQRVERTLRIVLRRMLRHLGKVAPRGSKNNPVIAS